MCPKSKSSMFSLVFGFSSCSILFSLWKATSGPSSSPVPRSKTLTWWWNQCETNRRFPPGNSFQLDTSWCIQTGFHEQSRFTWPKSISCMNVWFCLTEFLAFQSVQEYPRLLWISLSSAFVVEHSLALLQWSMKYTLYYQAARYA